jgi:N utilization substance protein A
MEALKQISREKGIDEEVIYEAIETSLVTACKKNFGSNANTKVNINRQTGKVDVYAEKTVVGEVTDPAIEISVADAQKIDIRYMPGDIVDVVVTPRNFGRISAQTAKPVVVQKFREAERTILYNEYIAKEHDVVTGVVQRKDRRNVMIALGSKIEAMLPASEQIPHEEYEFNTRLKVFVTEVKQTTKGPQITVSRTHPDLVKRLFEAEVPEIFDGTVEVRAIARDPGSRSKVAVSSNLPDVDPVGACIGHNRTRVDAIVAELRGEKMDIVKWNAMPEKFIAAALKPSDVLAVVLDPEEQTARVVVPERQLSLAIGKAGQNAKLAAKLTGWKIDIKSEAQAQETNFVSDEAYDMFASKGLTDRAEGDY